MVWIDVIAMRSMVAPTGCGRQCCVAMLRQLAAATSRRVNGLLLRAGIGVRFGSMDAGGTTAYSPFSRMTFHPLLCTSMW